MRDRGRAWRQKREWMKSKTSFSKVETGFMAMFSRDISKISHTSSLRVKNQKNNRATALYPDLLCPPKKARDTGRHSLTAPFFLLTELSRTILEGLAGLFSHQRHDWV